MKDISLKEALLILGMLLGLVACKKGVPEVTTMKSLSGFYLDNSSATADSKTSPSFAISGRCTSKFKDIEISLDKGATWKTVKTWGSPYSMNCANGSFSATLKMASTDFPTSIASLSSYDLIFRGSSDFGYSDRQAFLLSFSGKNGLGAVVSGSSGGWLISSGANYQMLGRLRDISQGSIMISSGSNYQMVGGLLRK